MNLNLIGVNSQKKYDNLTSITLPARNGEMEILTNHAETFARLTRGEIILKSGKRVDKEEVPLDSLCYIKGNSVTVIV